MTAAEFNARVLAGREAHPHVYRDVIASVAARLAGDAYESARSVLGGGEIDHGEIARAAVDIADGVVAALVGGGR